MPEAVDGTALLWSLAGILFGGGATGVILYRAFRDKLAEDFERRDKGDPVVRESDVGAFAQAAELDQFRAQFKADVDGIGGKVDGLIGMHTRLNDRMEVAERAIGSLQSENEHALGPLAKRFDDFQRRQEERDRQLAETLGNLKGTIDTFMREHRKHGRD